MPPIYDRPTKTLMVDFAKEKLTSGQVFHPRLAIDWFAAKYPKINPHTVGMHVDGMAVNNIARRRHHSNIKPGSGHDLFWKLGSGEYRLWEPDTDPRPTYKTDVDAGPADAPAAIAIDSDDAEDEDESEGVIAGSREFAFERDLKNYLARNLGAIERGLRLYDEEGVPGIEYPVGGRFIDILGIAEDGAFVVIELKVSRGYDRTLGQLMRYMGWIRKNLAKGKPVRGIIVASGITEDLKLAAWAPDVKLVEYEIEFRLKAVEA